MRRPAAPLCCAVLLMAAWPAAAGAAPMARAVDHAPFDALLQRHVRDGRVDYEGLGQDQDALEAYLVAVAAAHPDYWDARDQLVFWINAYNACALLRVLELQPEASVEEIEGFFDELRRPVGSRDLTLDQIEAQVRALGGWRARLATVRPALGAPALRAEAYAADRLDVQLEAQTRAFLADPVNGVRVRDDTLWVSSLFKEHPKDLAVGRLTAQALLGAFRPWLPAAFDRVSSADLRVKWIPFNWALNAATAARE